MTQNTYATFPLIHATFYQANAPSSSTDLLNSLQHELACFPCNASKMTIMAANPKPFANSLLWSDCSAALPDDRVYKMYYCGAAGFADTPEITIIHGIIYFDVEFRGVF